MSQRHKVRQSLQQLKIPNSIFLFKQVRLLVLCLIFQTSSRRGRFITCRRGHTKEEVYIREASKNCGLWLGRRALIFCRNEVDECAPFGDPLNRVRTADSSFEVYRKLNAHSYSCCGDGKRSVFITRPKIPWKGVQIVNRLREVPLFVRKIATCLDNSR